MPIPTYHNSGLVLPIVGGLLFLSLVACQSTPRREGNERPREEEVSATASRLSTNGVPDGRAFIFAQGDHESGKATIWAIDGVRCESFNLRKYGHGALIKAGPRTIRIQFEKPLPISGKLATQLSLPATFMSGHIYVVRFGPAVIPQTQRPTYHIWINDLTDGKVLVEGPYLAPL